MTLAPTREITRPISRATSEDVVRDTSLKKLQQSLAEFGNARLAEMRGHRRYPTDLESGVSTGLADGETMEEFKRDVLDGLTNRLRPELTPLRVDIHPGTQVVAAPYEHSWQTGFGQPWAHFDGRMTLVGGDEFSGAGFSFFITASADVSVAVTPQGTYGHQFTDLQIHPNLLTTGGAGSKVYDSGGTTIVDTKATLWNRVGMSPGTGESVNIAMADITAISGGPFPGQRLFPVLFDMRQGDTYEVWIYLWNACANTAGTPFFCTQSGRAPVVTVDAGPPIIVH
ncbi:hypothetical protein AR457_38055 [Streptomyces agglomeratus]|uniref:hypothetical protein n=1 Tax=Streptomyces agglomeratus TaxID=285458 RepID=UPI0008528BA2|nr:hypothetical protein [Streptomyces agglomeratus]OEJ23008.1 hypothetical protein AR457_38055 [Streptomyces agglomeratus]OEJ36855.1 hypothetical protein BGK70_00300 [Streptomyces agglomeratus]